MVVKIRFPKKDKGDQVVSLELENARHEIATAMEQGYVVTRQKKSDQEVLTEAIQNLDDVQDGEQVTIFPTGMGG